MNPVPLQAGMQVAAFVCLVAAFLAALMVGSVKADDRSMIRGYMAACFTLALVFGLVSLLVK